MKFHVISGYLAAFIFIIMLIPQIYKSFKTKSVNDLSLCFIFLFVLGSALMLYYAIIENALPIVVNNIFGLSAGLILLLAYYLYKGNKHKNNKSTSPMENYQDSL